jgi:hypothetical protein
MFGLFITVAMVGCRGVGSWVAGGGSGVARGGGSRVYSAPLLPQNPNSSMELYTMLPQPMATPLPPTATQLPTPLHPTMATVMNNPNITVQFLML